MDKRTLTCIGCPLGCTVEVTTENGQILSVTGNTCKRGEDYARKEVTNPTRIVTTTVRVSGGRLPVVPCKTGSDIPKDRIFDCVRALRDLTVAAPIHIGDILLPDVCGTGVDIITTADMEKV